MLQYPKSLSIGQIAKTIERTITDVNQGNETESRQEKREKSSQSTATQPPPPAWRQWNVFSTLMYWEDTLKQRCYIIPMRETNYLKEQTTCAYSQPSDIHRTASHTLNPTSCCTWTGLVGKASPPPHAPINPPVATVCSGMAAWMSPVYCEEFPETHIAWSLT